MVLSPKQFNVLDELTENFEKTFDEIEDLLGICLKLKDTDFNYLKRFIRDF